MCRWTDVNDELANGTFQDRLGDVDFIHVCHLQEYGHLQDEK